MWNWLWPDGRPTARRRRTEPGRLLSLESLELRSVLSAIVWDPDGNGGIDPFGSAFDSTPVPDPALVQEGDGAAGGSAAGSPNTLDLAQTFLLHSLAGANQVIYLDFDGAVTSGTQWNSSFTGGADIVTPAYDTDGDPSAFSSGELANIQYIWQRVAEDYAPFNVDVTTQDPGLEALRKTSTSDTQWGIHVVIGGNGSWYGSAGGVTYVGSFDWNTDTPSFVFPGMLGNGNEKYTAEAISHEVGHSLGLSHDGTATSSYYYGSGSGDTGWAPIMGAGYYENLTQFSKGEYAGANNTQDDLAIITTQNGFGYRPDDYGNTFASAFSLTPTGGTVSAKGIIERNTDDDMFGFYTGSGAVNFSIVPADRGPNLDIKASLYDASGNLILVSNPIGSLSASFSTTLAQGQYFLKIEGTGEGDPLNGGYSNYDSLGQYWITGTIVDPGSVPVLSVSDASAVESAGTMTFRLSLAAPATQTLTVAYTTADGTALAGSDYVATSGTVTFAPGEYEKFVTVSLINDTIGEPTETFQLNASAFGGQAVSVTRQGTGTILDDDLTVSVNSVSKAEGNPTGNGSPSLTSFTFTITLSGPAPAGGVTVSYATADGTATAGSDYIATSGTVTFAAGETTKTVTVTVYGDATVEPDETFYLNLTGASGASVTNGVGTGTIVNDDTGAVAKIRGKSGKAAIPNGINVSGTPLHDTTAALTQTPATPSAPSLTAVTVPVTFFLSPTTDTRVTGGSEQTEARAVSSDDRGGPASIVPPPLAAVAPAVRVELTAPAASAARADSWDFLLDL